jgi:hypothetical protein
MESLGGQVVSVSGNRKAHGVEKVASGRKKRAFNKFFLAYNEL